MSWTDCLVLGTRNTERFGAHLKWSGLAIFAGQQRHIIESHLRSVALIVARSQSQAAREFFIGLLQGYEMLYWDTMLEVTMA